MRWSQTFIPTLKEVRRDMALLSTLVALLGVAVLPSRGAESAQTNPSREVVVGGRNIHLPAPMGFDRVDGLDPEVDRTLNAMLPDTNRCLARFEPSATDSASEGRNFNAQVQGALEGREIGTRTFSEIKQDMKSEMDKMRESIVKELAKQSVGAEKNLQDMIDANAALSVSDVVVLGCFDDSPNCLGFTVAMNMAMKVGDRDSKSKVVGAAMIVPVNGRLISLNATSVFNSASDRQWAEQAVTAWRDAVLAANPSVEGPAAKPSIFSGTGRSALIGGVVGGVATLVMAALGKFKKKA